MATARTSYIGWNGVTLQSETDLDAPTSPEIRQIFLFQHRSHRGCGVNYTNLTWAPSDKRVYCPKNLTLGRPIISLVSVLRRYRGRPVLT